MRGVPGIAKTLGRSRQALWAALKPVRVVGIALADRARSAIRAVKQVTASTAGGRGAASGRSGTGARGADSVPDGGLDGLETGAEAARSLVEGLDGPGIGKKSRQRPCSEVPAAGDRQET